MRKLWLLEVSKRHEIKKKDFPDFGIIFVKKKGFMTSADVISGISAERKRKRNYDRWGPLVIGLVHGGLGSPVLEKRGGLECHMGS